MPKIVDLDELFDKYIHKYVYESVGKISPDEIENSIPLLYEKFGDVPLNELDNKSPKQYYDTFSADELLSLVKEHMQSNIPVSDFLTDTLTHKENILKELDFFLKNASEEKFIKYILNLYLNIKSCNSLNDVLNLVIYDYDREIKNLATEILVSEADKIKESVLEIFNDVQDENKEYLTEILASTDKDNRVFDLLVAEFLRHTDKISLYANYLAKYGDERAIPLLLEKIKDNKIGYAEFMELRFAIERLGGEYLENRDFSNDKNYRKIKTAKHGRIV